MFKSFRHTLATLCASVLGSPEMFDPSALLVKSHSRSGPGKASIVSNAEARRRAGGKYTPHQGARECARRRGDLRHEGV